MTKTWNPQVYWSWKERNRIEVVSVDKRDHEYADKISYGDKIRIEGRFLEVKNIYRVGANDTGASRCIGNRYEFSVKPCIPDQSLMRFVPEGN